MVKVIYQEPYRTSFGKEEERVQAETLGVLIEKIEKKYDGKDHANTLLRYSTILLNNELWLSNNRLEFRLKPKDEILIMRLLNGVY